MLALKKKKPEVVRQWHPNFRDVKTLPDIKAVRTDFVVNFAAVTMAVFALGWMVYVEVGIFQVNRQIAHWQARIDEQHRNNAQDLQLSGQFVHEAKPLQQLTKFYAQMLPPMQLLATAVAAKPDNILFDSVKLTPTEIENSKRQRFNVQQITLDGTMTGEAEDLRRLDDMVTKIMASPVLKARIADPANDRKIDNRREGPGLFKFTITITLKPSA